MQNLLNAINLFKTHWKLLLIVFALGGTSEVLGLTGITPAKDFVDAKLQEVSATIVSPTVVQ